jgi:HK97 family phage prohead protease
METEPRDSSGLVFRSLGVRSINKEERSIEVVASTDSVDSYGEIVAQNWKLDRYLANPVVLFAHQSRALPVGRAEDVMVRDGALQAKFIFATAEANPLAEQVWQSIAQKTLRGVSVGFMPATVRMEKRDDKEVWVLDDNELFEISMTPVPANPNGLAKMKARAFETYRAGASPSRDEVTHMDPEKLKAELTTKSAELETAQRDTKAKDDRIKTLETEVRAGNELAANLQKSLDAEKARADKLDAQSASDDVDAVVGKKISLAQKDEFLELRTSMGREKFAAFVSKFTDLKLTEEKIPNEGTSANKNTATKGANSPSKLLAKANEHANRARGDH